MSGPPSFVVVAATCRRTAALPRGQFGHQREHVIVEDRCREATVVYAADLGRAHSMAKAARKAGGDFVLLDLHVAVAESMTHLRHLCAAKEAREAHSRAQNRLVYCGTESGLRSYLADLARLGLADGVVVSSVG
ncbi:hypothetical protein [Mycobacterium sp. GA-2829]|uniref:hypothetical protein n=1 Tax=Mycobacterium sp. GA-2829 TaxID=1772283 RepID=UPI0007400D77|nr:hypothetical protein [Mycobacterium sp. GA-2829]KUI39259.1 hypothetical protein AU194_14630 [Mycobacterium sp. GA-2829]